jgi:hypothetical protein
MASIYKKAKKNFIILFISVFFLIITNLIINDLIEISSDKIIFLLLLSRWCITLILLSLIIFSITKISNIIVNPFEKKDNQSLLSTTSKVYKDEKKDYLLSKEKLLTKSDLIMNKYTKN